MSPAFDDPIFTNEDAAREALESIRWPDGPVCVHCGCTGAISRVEGEKKSHRPGLLYCNDCKGQFTVTVGTVFERSKIPLTKWWLATFLLCSSKKGISSHQIHRTLGVTYKTAWFMTHRIRHAMAEGGFGGLMGSGGGTVEADETYIGRKPGVKKGRGGYAHKEAVVALVERKGKVRSMHVGRITGENLRAALHGNVSPKAKLMTDEATWYRNIGKNFASHESVMHSEREYVRGDVHTNTIEGVFSILKRGLIGVYQHCGSDHLHRYLAEFDFRYNNRVALGVDDNQRTVTALRGIEGKRLTYRRPDEAQADCQ
jgi:transposase-like protein